MAHGGTTGKQFWLSLASLWLTAGQRGARTHVNRPPHPVVYLEVQRELSADFDRFVLDRSTALLRTAVLLVGDVGHAEDILQTALMRLATR